MSTYRDKHGQWWAAVEAGYTRTGSRKRIRRQATGQKAAASLERKLLRDRDAGTLIDGGSPTVKKWGEEWLEIQKARVRPSTWSGYQTAIRAYAIPAIGNVKLHLLTPGHIRAVTKAVRAGNTNTSTAARDVQVRLMKCLRDALSEGHSVPPTALAVVKPTRAATDRTAIPLDQVRPLLKVIEQRTDRSRWIAALLQGMRQGECLGLTWACVDLAGFTLDVSWQLQPVRFQHGCDTTGARPACGRKYGGDCPRREHQVPDGYEYRPLRGALCLVRPKTSRGQRIIPLVPWMVTALQEWQAIAPTSVHGLVWPDAEGEPQLGREDSAIWYALQKLAGVHHPKPRPWALHEARHTTATLLLEAGVDPHTVTAVLGHSSITTSRGYQHVNQALARQAMEAVADRLGLPALTSG